MKMMKNVRIDLDLSGLTEDRLQKIILTAYLFGYMREDPTKAWSEKEYRECVRFVVTELFRRKIYDKKMTGSIS